MSDKRPRSPDYPHYSLRECVKFLDRFIQKNGMAEAHRDMTVSFMKHSATSSTADRLVAAMQHYGLFDVRGTGNNRYFTPSQLAKEIYQPTDQLKALQKAALWPEAMKVVYGRFGCALPPTGTISEILLADFRFSALGAKRFSEVVVSNYEYAGLSGPVEAAFGNPDDSEVKVVTKEYRIPIGNGRDFVFTVPVDITEAEFDYVAEILSMFKERLAQKEQRVEADSPGDLP